MAEKAAYDNAATVGGVPLIACNHCNAPKEVQPDTEPGLMIGHEGAMFVGKSSALTSAAHKAIRKGKKVHVMRPAGDERDRVLGLKTHDGTTLLQSELLSYASYETVPSSHALYDMDISMLIVEEAQFFGKQLPQLVDVLDRLADYGVEIHVAFLNGTFERVPFHGIDLLRARCDKVKHYRGNCRFCHRKGSFSMALKKLDPGQFHPGADELYALVCRKCYNERVKNAVVAPHNK